MNKISLDFLKIYDIIIYALGGMMELADLPDSKSGGGNTVWVRGPLPLPTKAMRKRCFFCLKAGREESGAEKQSGGLFRPRRPNGDEPRYSRSTSANDKKEMRKLNQPIEKSTQKADFRQFT